MTINLIIPISVRGKGNFCAIRWPDWVFIIPHNVSEADLPGIRPRSSHKSDYYQSVPEENAIFPTVCDQLGPPSSPVDVRRVCPVSVRIHHINLKIASTVGSESNFSCHPLPLEVRVTYRVLFGFMEEPSSDSPAWLDSRVMSLPPDTVWEWIDLPVSVQVHWGDLQFYGLVGQKGMSLPPDTASSESDLPGTVRVHWGDLRFSSLVGKKDVSPTRRHYFSRFIRRIHHGYQHDNSNQDQHSTFNQIFFQNHSPLSLDPSLSDAFFRNPLVKRNSYKTASIDRLITVWF